MSAGISEALNGSASEIRLSVRLSISGPEKAFSIDVVCAESRQRTSMPVLVNSDKSGLSFAAILVMTSTDAPVRFAAKGEK